MECNSTVRVQRATLELLRRHEAIGTDVGTLVAGAAARCEPLERAARESLESGLIPHAHRTEISLHGDLVASRTSLFYVIPQAGYVWSRPWSQVRLEAARPPKLGLGRSRLVVAADHEEIRFLVSGRTAVAQLLEVATKPGGV